MTYLVSLNASCFDPYQTEQVIQTRRHGDLWFYRVFLYVTGAHLPYITCATYELPTHLHFRNARQHVQRTVANPYCRLEVWSWSEFDVNASIGWQAGGYFHLSCRAAIGEQVKANPDRIKIVP